MLLKNQVIFFIVFLKKLYSCNNRVINYTNYLLDHKLTKH